MLVFVLVHGVAVVVGRLYGRAPKEYSAKGEKGGLGTRRPRMEDSLSDDFAVAYRSSFNNSPRSSPSSNNNSPSSNNNSPSSNNNSPSSNNSPSPLEFHSNSDDKSPSGNVYPLGQKQKAYPYISRGNTMGDTNYRQRQESIYPLEITEPTPERSSKQVLTVAHPITVANDIASPEDKPLIVDPIIAVRPVHDSAANRKLYALDGTNETSSGAAISAAIVVVALLGSLALLAFSVLLLRKYSSKASIFEDAQKDRFSTMSRGFLQYWKVQSLSSDFKPPAKTVSKVVITALPLNFPLDDLEESEKHDSVQSLWHVKGALKHPKSMLSLDSDDTASSTSFILIRKSNSKPLLLDDLTSNATSDFRSNVTSEVYDNLVHRVASTSDASCVSAKGKY
jgi:hypothetical protein